MRRINFRAWDTEKEKMQEVVTLDFFSGNVNDDEFYNMKPLFDFNCILMQYIGLKDKNDKEIYEGDILSIKTEGEEPIISEVVWGGVEYPAFDLPKYDGYGANSFSAIFHNDVEESLEVIGNIYENLELLED